MLTHKPEGGNHREKLQKRKIEKSVELANLLLEETGVAMLPGSAFARK